MIQTPFGKLLGLDQLYFFPVHVASRQGFTEVNKLMIVATKKPNGSSRKGLAHYGQIINSGRFALYDMYDKNQKVYGQDKPPLIDLSYIDSAPIAMFVGIDDVLVSPSDARWTRSQLKKEVVAYYEEYEDVNHSFTHCKDMSYLKDMVKVIEKYDNKV